MTYALSVLTYAQPYIHPIFVAITSRNAGSVRTRTVASALYNMAVQAAAVIGINVSSHAQWPPSLFARMRQLTNVQIYRNSDKPLYYKGNTALIIIAIYNIAVMVGAKIFYVKVNR